MPTDQNKTISQAAFEELTEEQRLDLLNLMHKHSVQLIDSLEGSIRHHNIMAMVAGVLIITYLGLIIFDVFGEDSPCDVADEYVNVYVMSSVEAVSLELQKTPDASARL